MSRPVFAPESHSVTFGPVEGQNRGPADQLFDPPRTVDDPYFRLRDDSRTDPEVLAYLKAENDHFAEQLSGTDGLRETVYAELKHRLIEADESVGYTAGRRAGRWEYFVRTVPGQSYPLHFRRSRDGLDEQLVIDGNQLAAGRENFDLRYVNYADDGEQMIYTVDDVGDEKYEVFHRKSLPDGPDVSLGLKLPYSEIDWLPGSRQLMYLKGDATNRLNTLWLLDLETRLHTLLLREPDPESDLSLAVMNSGNFVRISSVSTGATELRVYDLDTTRLTLVVSRSEKLRVENFAQHGDYFYFRVNLDEAGRFQLARLPVAEVLAPGWMFSREKVETVRRFDDQFRKLVALEDYLLLELVTTDGRVRVERIDRHGKMHPVTVFDRGNTKLSTNAVYETTEVNLTHQSFVDPTSWWAVDLRTGEKRCRKTTAVPDYDPEEYVSWTERIPSHDGVEIPVSLVARKGVRDAPLHLYGYGAYGVTIDPRFQANRLPLLERGFICAIAHVRGGGFLGRRWYLDGKMEKKMNTFLDTIAVAEGLVEKGWTRPELITLVGRSAGGLLATGSMLLRPDLFHTVVADVPFTDVLTTMCDPTIPLTTGEWSEWGNPNIPAEFETMAKYDPYFNLRRGAFPHTLLTGGLHDPRVGYWDPAKFHAKLLTCQTETDRLNLLKTELDAGHFGGSDRYRHLRELAYEYSFILATYEAGRIDRVASELALGEPTAKKVKTV